MAQPPPWARLRAWWTVGWRVTLALLHTVYMYVLLRRSDRHLVSRLSGRRGGRMLHTTRIVFRCRIHVHTGPLSGHTSGGGGDAIPRSTGVYPSSPRADLRLAE